MPFPPSKSPSLPSFLSSSSFPTQQVSVKSHRFNSTLSRQVKLVYTCLHSRYHASLSLESSWSIPTVHTPMAFTPTRQASNPLSIRTRDDSVSLKSPRVARFAEATSVDSPIDGPVGGNRFNDRTPYTPVEYVKPQLQPGDVGFGFVNDRRSMAEIPDVEMPREDSPPPQQQPPLQSPGLKSPLKSAMKSPGLKPPMKLDIPLKSPMFQEDMILSPTWREEKLLEKREARTTRRQADDLVSRGMVLRWYLPLTRSSSESKSACAWPSSSSVSPTSPAASSF